MKRKWPAPELESELKRFENLAPEPLKFSRLHQPWSGAQPERGGALTTTSTKRQVYA